MVDRLQQPEERQAGIRKNSLQSSLNFENGLGTTCVAIIYGVLIVSSFLAPPFIERFGVRNVLLCGWFCHTLFILANMWPHWATLIPASILVGVASGFIWVAQGSYVSRLGVRLSEASSLASEPAMGRLFAAFSAVLALMRLFGYVLSSLILYSHKSNENLDVNGTTTPRPILKCGALHCPMEQTDHFEKPPKRIKYILLGIYLAFNILGIFIILALQNIGEQRENRQSPASFGSAFKKKLKRTLLLFRKPLMSALLCITVVNALNEATLHSSFTQSFVICTHGVKMVGLVLLVTCTVYLVTSLIVGWVVRYIPSSVMVFVGFCVLAAFALTGLFLQTGPEMFSSLLLLSASIGAALGILLPAKQTLAGFWFKDRKTEAYGLEQSFNALVQCIAYAYSRYLCIRVKFYIFLGFLLIAFVIYTIQVIRKKALTLTTQNNNLDTTEMRRSRSLSARENSEASEALVPMDR
ncbi:DgyrCDS14234 [Dimorphilus gyrociliatus]|uniref:DgyrCDS14234 n=1 Tax=Dimorphilus gyrociliatus TaxID=2664684 RepID=A0A7I8WD26_9ANNE|nr:DgyrCDS14234 [Dimorphilus gyrociliatus]